MTVFKKKRDHSGQASLKTIKQTDTGKQVDANGLKAKRECLISEAP